MSANGCLSMWRCNELSLVQGATLPKLQRTPMTLSAGWMVVEID